MRGDIIIRRVAPGDGYNAYECWLEGDGMIGSGLKGTGSKAIYAFNSLTRQVYSRRIELREAEALKARNDRRDCGNFNWWERLWGVPGRWKKAAHQAP